MTGLDLLTMDLPAGYQAQGDDDRGRRRWLDPDGTYVLAETATPPDGASDPIAAADVTMATTLGSYQVSRGGRVELMGAVPVPGAEAARAARLMFESVTGELLDALVVVASTSQEVVIVHIVWSAAGTEQAVASALAVAESVRLTR